MCPQSAELGSWNSTFPPRSPTLMGAAIERGRKLKNSKWRQEMSFFAQLPWAISSNIQHTSIAFYQIILISNWINLDYTRIFDWGYRGELYLTGPLNLEVHHIIDVNLFTILQSFKICASGFLMYPSPLTRPPLPKELMVVLHDGGSSKLLPNSDENKDA